ncbi:hypothetical protein C5167_028368 [Papaver somniferum]|nr:hypothetical protein C5167_028368 [Papaver somniferum]
MDVHHQIADFNTHVSRLFPPANQGTTYYVQQAQFFSRSVYPWFPRYCVAHGFYWLISIGLYYAHLPKCSVGYRGGHFCFSLFSPVRNRDVKCELRWSRSFPCSRKKYARSVPIVIMHKVRFQEAASMTENIIGMVINIQLQSITEAANHGGGFGVYHPKWERRGVRGKKDVVVTRVTITTTERDFFQNCDPRNSHGWALFWDLPPYLNSRELSLKLLGEETLVQLVELALIWMLSEETLVLLLQNECRFVSLIVKREELKTRVWCWVCVVAVTGVGAN